MLERANVGSGTEWEKIISYSRAVRIGNVIEVSGTAAVNGNNVIGKNDAAEQTRFIIKKIEKALIQLGAGLRDVIRTRIFVTDISLWKEIGRVHGEFFKDIMPATSMVEVKALISPELLLEMEATAILEEK